MFGNQLIVLLDVIQGSTGISYRKVISSLYSRLACNCVQTVQEEFVYFMTSSCTVVGSVKGSKMGTEPKGTLITFSSQTGIHKDE